MSCKNEWLCLFKIHGRLTCIVFILIQTKFDFLQQVELTPDL